MGFSLSFLLLLLLNNIFMQFLLQDRYNIGVLYIKQLLCSLILNCKIKNQIANE
jgi:hypothetical protein